MGRLRRIAAATPKGRWLAFRPVNHLPNGAGLTISIGAGTPSAEGPRTTAAASEHTAACHFAWTAPPPAHVPEVDLELAETPEVERAAADGA